MRGWRLIIWLICVSAFLWLALDGAMHWDEPAYLYTGGFLSFQQILAGDFQPAGIAHFYLTRPLHVLMVHWITSLTGVGMPGLIGVISYCTLSLIGFLVFTFLILRELMPGLNRLGEAVALGLLIPVVSYLFFKTLPECGALLCASAAMYALIKGARAGTTRTAVVWLIAASVAIMLALWFKGPMLLLAASGVPAIVLFGGRGGDRFRLPVHTLIAAAAGLALAYAGVVMLGIDPSIYVGGVARVGGEHEPLTARILNNGTPPGLFLFVLPLAFFSSRKREVWLCLTWYVLAVVPLAVLFPSMEARYQAPQVPALIGLTALALDGVAPWLRAAWDKRPARVGVGIAVLAVFVVFSHTLAIAVMQHEVKVGDVRRMMDQLDGRYGTDGYALLTSWTYTDFLYLRFMYPDRPIYTAHTAEAIHKANVSHELMRSSHETYFGERMIERPEQMYRIGGRVTVLFGFHENFAAANLRSIFSHIPGNPLAGQLAKVHLHDHLATTWLWDNPAYELKEVVGVGHYHAFEVKQAVSGVDGSGAP
ncbi:MAG: hypothetical protein R3C45_04470 [Phycisphaerales bacterium]